MEPVELNHRLEVPAEVLSTLAEIGEKINASLDLDDVLSSAAALIKRLIDYEIFAVLLIEESTNQLYFHFAIGHKPEVVENWRVPLGHGITGTAAARREAMRVSDVSHYPGYLNALDSVRSELAVPLLVKGSCIGVLDIQSNHLNYFTPDQQNILTLLASRLAIAIGLSESTNARGELFGAEQIREILVANHKAPAADLANWIMDEVSLFSLGTRAGDDRTLVVLKVK